MPRRLFIFRTFCFVVLNLIILASVAKGPITGKTNAVDVNGSFAYLGVGQEMVVFNVIDPANPVLIGTVDALGDTVQDIQIVENLAFVAAGTAGLHIIDVSNPNQPQKISHFETPGLVNGLFVTEGHAYLAAGGAGLLVMDISNPSNPVPVSMSKTLAWDTDVVVSKGIAYVASGEEGVRMVDVTTPSNPLTIRSINTPNDANGVFVEGNLLFVAAGSGGLQIVNIENSSAPKEVVVEDTGYARRVVVDSGFAYVAIERKGVWALDITNPSTPKRVKRFVPEGSANSLDIEGDYIYVGDGTGGLLVIKVSGRRTIELRREFSPALEVEGP
ncbi:MAG: hypothetical protein V3V31_13880 [Methylococcales bacterium]